MAVPAPSALSIACQSVADFLKAQLHDLEGYETTDVVIGTPQAASAPTTDNHHQLNLFFYGFEPSGMAGEIDPNEPWRVRLRCLVTPFITHAEANVRPGEIELRLLGEALRIFHETPILDEESISGESFRLEIVPLHLSVEELNNLWSMQGDVSFRPSAGYEISLAPILPIRRAVAGPRVAELALEIGGMHPESSQATFRVVHAPTVGPFEVEPSTHSWVPRICLIHRNECREALRFTAGTPQLTEFKPKVWVAGRPGESVDLVWEVWKRSSGWSRLDSPTKAEVKYERIDPTVDVAGVTPVSLDFPLHVAGQAMLYAERTYARPSDGHRVSVRGNIVLVSVAPA